MSTNDRGRSNQTLAVACGLIALALALVGVQFSGTLQVVLMVVLFAGLVLCVARIGANVAAERRGS